MDEELLKKLPPVLKIIIKTLGIKRGKEFLLQHGGRTVYFAKISTDNLNLSCEELTALNSALHIFLNADNKITLPKADKISIHFRNIEIRQKKSTHSLTELAAMYHLTTRHISNIIKNKSGKKRINGGMV
jgi:hypothetical protein